MKHNQPSLDDRFSSRRSVLVAVGAATTAGLAGCLGGSDDSGDDGDDGDDDDNGDNGDDSGNGSDDPDNGGEDDSGFPDDIEAEFDLAGDGGESFREWIIPDNPISTDAEVEQSGIELVFRYEDFELAEQEGWEPMIHVREQTAAALGVDPEAVRGELIVGGPEELGGRIPILFGDFDVETIVEHFEGPGERQQTGEYRDYTIFDNIAAVGSAAVLETPRYEKYIDASVGDGTRLEDESEEVRVLFDLVPEGLETRVNRRPEESGLAIEAQTNVELDHEADQVRRVRTLIYESEVAVDLDHARDLVSRVQNFEEVLDEEHHGRVVMLSYLVNL